MTTAEPLPLGPELKGSVPGLNSRSWHLRAGRVAAPMGPKPGVGGPRGIVFARGSGANVWDVDGNRFVDLAAGFGSLLLGHAPPEVTRAIEVQSARLFQAMGDVYPSDAKIGLLEQLTPLFPEPGAQGILGLSGADAVTAALKTAVLATGRPGVVAFSGAYHGLSYGPLAACGLRESYREPFAQQLNPNVHWLPYPGADVEPESVAGALEAELATGRVGAVLYEPILGRGGVVPMSPDVAGQLRELTTRHGALLVADEIWTGLGRSGSWLWSTEQGVVPDLICLGKGLGGGLPLSACLGRAEVMAHWSRDAEVVHTSTFAGAALSCVTALATLDALRRGALVERAKRVGVEFAEQLRRAVEPFAGKVRGAGLMLGIELAGQAGEASALAQALLQRGYITSTGGGRRETLVLTPPLNVHETQLAGFVEALAAALRERGR